MQSYTRPLRLGGIMATLLLSALLLGCGAARGAGAASVAATPTCPPRPTFKTVMGHVSAVGTGTITVKDTSGATTQVQLTTSTRVTETVSVAATSLTAGTPVLVLTDTDATVAQRISVLPQGAAGTGGTGGAGGAGGFGQGRGSGTPAAGTNRGCFQRTGQPQGQGQGSGFQGLRGTVDSVTSTQLTFDDVQGQTYMVAITHTTVIQRNSQGQTSDLKVGQNVTVVGSETASGLTARSINVQG